MKWSELKAKFLKDLLPGEQLFFLKQARECANEKGYPVSEDLFNYCFFLTLRERLRLIGSGDGEGMMRFMLVESRGRSRARYGRSRSAWKRGNGRSTMKRAACCSNSSRAEAPGLQQKNRLDPVPAGF